MTWWRLLAGHAVRQCRVRGARGVRVLLRFAGECAGLGGGAAQRQTARRDSYYFCRLWISNTVSWGGVVKLPLMPCCILGIRISLRKRSQLSLES
jgi:hypothetical protein